MKELGSGTAYNTHNTTSLIRTLKYVSDVLQTEEALTVKGYKHTHTRTHEVSKKQLNKNNNKNSNNNNIKNSTCGSIT